MNAKNIHATAVVIEKKAVLILGKSGAGKSDLAFRLIMDKNAELIADDRVDIENVNGVLKAACPKNIQGLLEVRGIGICKFPVIESAEVLIAVQLVENPDKIERLPEKETIEFLNVKIPLLKLYPFEASASDKIILACYQNR